MVSARFESAAAAFCAALALAAMIVAFSIGQAGAQPVTPPIVQPPPTFNPSTPNTVAQPPPAPLSPAPSSGLSAPGPAPSSEPVVPPPSESPQPVTPPTANPPAAAKPVVSHTHARRHYGRAHRHRRHVRYHARELGPSYYPGLGEFYPPYVNPCHPSHFWSGVYAGYPTYSCW